MEIVTLPEGTVADITEDCVSIERGEDGRYYLTGAVLSGEESVAIGPSGYDDFEGARDAGIAWAAGHGSRKLFVTTTVYEPEATAIARD